MLFILYSICISVVTGSSEPPRKFVARSIDDEKGYIRTVAADDSAAFEIPDDLFSGDRKRKRESFEDTDVMELIVVANNDESNSIREKSPLNDSIDSETTDDLFGHPRWFDEYDDVDDDIDRIFPIEEYYLRVFEWTSSRGDVRVVCLTNKNPERDFGDNIGQYIARTVDLDDSFVQPLLTVYLFDDHGEPVVDYSTDLLRVDQSPRFFGTVMTSPDDDLRVPTHPDSLLSTLAQRFVFALKSSAEVWEAMDLGDFSPLRQALQLAWTKASDLTHHVLTTVGDVFGEEELIGFGIRFENMDYHPKSPEDVLAQFIEQSVVHRIGIHVPENLYEGILLYPIGGRSWAEEELVVQFLRSFSIMRIFKYDLDLDSPIQFELGNHIAQRLNTHWEATIEYY